MMLRMEKRLEKTCFKEVDEEWHPSMSPSGSWNAMFFCWVTAPVGREIADEIHQDGNPIIATLDVFYFDDW